MCVRLLLLLVLDEIMVGIVFIRGLSVVTYVREFSAKKSWDELIEG